MFNICQKIDQIKLLIKEAKLKGQRISVVPTMGSLHKGHLELIKEAKLQSDFVIVTIFINKKQFDKIEDFNKYPKNINNDLEKLKKIGVDAVFAPSNEEIYPKENIISINVSQINQILCGKDRLGHFNGVALIIIKLFLITTPDIAIFGLKDYQQFFIIQRIVKELNFNIKIIGIETIREDNGLALSSRNLRLSFEGKNMAQNIFKVLNDIKKKILNHNNINIDILLQESSQKLLDLGFSKIIYLEIRNQDNLELCYKFDSNKKYRIFISAIIEDVRLIDQISLF